MFQVWKLKPFKLLYLTRKWGSLDQQGHLILKTQPHADLLRHKKTSVNLIVGTSIQNWHFIFFLHLHLPVFACIFIIHFFIIKRDEALRRYSEPSRSLKARNHNCYNLQYTSIFTLEINSYKTGSSLKPSGCCNLTADESSWVFLCTLVQMNTQLR